MRCDDNPSAKPDTKPAPDAGPICTEIKEGQGPCAQGVNLTIEGKQYVVPLMVLPRTSVAIEATGFRLKRFCGGLSRSLKPEA